MINEFLIPFTLMENYLELPGWLAENPFKSFAVLFIQFILAMKLHHKFHSKFLHVVIMFWFIPQDVVVNAVLFSILGAELPREFTVTSRLKRWKAIDKPKGTRQIVRHNISWWLCGQLNKYDVGHC